MRLRSEQELDEKHLDNFFKFGPIKGPKIEDLDPEDDKGEPLIPDGYHIISFNGSSPIPRTP